MQRAGFYVQFLKAAKIGVIARLSSFEYENHLTHARINLDPGSHAKEVGVEDPAEETFAARILHILSTFPTGSQAGPVGMCIQSRISAKKPDNSACSQRHKG